MGKSGGGGGKKGGDAPAAPDYRGAARETSEGSIQAAITNALLNRYNVNSPLGSQTWAQRNIGSVPVPAPASMPALSLATAPSPASGVLGGSYVLGQHPSNPPQTGETATAGSVNLSGMRVPQIGSQPGFDLPMWDQTIELSPEQKDLYDRQTGLSSGLLGLGQSSLDQTRDSLGKPQDLSSIDQIADRSYGLQTKRLDSQWAQNEQAMAARLADQGIPIGSEAHENAMREFGQSRNDAYERARLSSIGTMPQTYQLATAQRMQPLSELNAIRSGAQPQMPQFQAVPAAGGAQGPNMLGAAGQQGAWDQGQANMEAGQQNSKKSSMGSIAGAAAMFF